MTYTVTTPLTLPVRANPRFRDLSRHEEGGRIIGGDKGDLIFDGYDLDDTSTTLSGVKLRTDLDLTEDEVNDIAKEILQFSYESIGIETVEHS